MSNQTNPQCATCEKAYNGLNGRFCNVLKKYVEYAAKPLCNTKE